MNSILTFLKGVISGIFVLSFWPIMITVMLAMKYIVNPFYEYIVNPIKSLYAKFTNK